MVDQVSSVLVWFWLLWCICNGLRELYAVCARLFRALKYPALVYVIWPVPATIFFDHKVPSFWDILWTLISFTLWYLNHKDDDDEFKKLKKRIHDRVTQHGHRLVVVPQTA